MRLIARLDRRLRTARDRRRAIAVAAVVVSAVLVLAVAAALRGAGQPGDRAGNLHGAPRPAQTPARAPAKDAAARPSPRRAATRFLRAYLRYLDGRAGRSALDNAGVSARQTAVETGPAPTRARGGSLRLIAVGPPAPGGAGTELTARASDGLHTYSMTVALHYASGRWLVERLVPPDFATETAPATGGRPPPAAQAARKAARRFAQGYVDYVDLVRRRQPASLASIRRQIRARRDPLATATPSGFRARVRRIDLGPAQGRSVTATAKVNTGIEEVEFSFVLARSGSTWRPSAFIDQG